jgi:hypothetical protein
MKGAETNTASFSCDKAQQSEEAKTKDTVVPVLFSPGSVGVHIANINRRFSVF